MTGASPGVKRPSEATFVAEGLRTVEAVLDSPLTTEAIIMIRDAEVKGSAAVEDAARRRGVEVRRVDRHNAKKYMSTKTPQGVAAIVRRPEPPTIESLATSASRLLVLDGLADPGNVGTLVRAAWLMEWDAVVMTPGGADFYGEKAVRASAGAIAFIPTAIAPAGSLTKSLRAAGWMILEAVPGTEDSRPQITSAKIALVLGGEAHGQASSWPGAARVGVAIRRSPVDSLGVVAGGSILLERFRSR